MKKRILSLLLALVMTASMLPVFSVAAAGSYTPEDITSNYFYNQLNDRAKAIYKKLLDEFTNTATKETYYEGTQPIDLIGVNYLDGSAKSGPIITENDIKEYAKGNKDLFNDFCAAKDALDLDHSELWYIDSGYLTFRVTHSSAEPELTTGYHVLIGPGRGETYLLGGLPAEDIELSGKTIESMDEEINDTIDEMVKEALSALNKATADVEYSRQDQLAFLATNIHDQITKGIHYRYEIECTYPEDAKFIRTIYGIQTHEGVCEAYARTLQVCLTKLGIESVLVHGVQTKGTPEDHMWNAVNIPDGNENHWYVIDATWDDPLTANWDGTRDLTFKNGEDGKETNTYLLVGQSLVGEHWRPSGYVSTGNFEFKYPTIETAAYSGETIVDSDNGLKVKYSTGGSEEGVPAGVYTVTFKGWNAAKAAEHGFYFMVKMYDYHPDGTADVMDEWYYAAATIAVTGKNDFFGDYNDGLRVYSATCEYVEFAVTSLQPYGIETWNLPASENALSRNPDVGYFHGDDSQIVAQSGMLYNVNSKYEAPPYVLTQFPAPNGNCTAGYDYRFDVVFDDDLTHPQDNDPAAADAFTDDTQLAANQTVRVRYTTIQQDLHTGGEKYVQIAGELPFDLNRDGYVDMPGDKGVTTDKAALKWKYKSVVENTPCTNPNHPDGGCDVNKGCAIVGVEFNFRASDQWIDDITEYNFSIEGVVGSRSNKFPNNFSVISCIPGLCPACYRSQGIDWNLWGQPTLLDAPENLDLYNMAKEGGTDKATLDKLNEEMNRDDLNGRLMLVVEDKSKGAGNREDYERINDALPEDEKNAIAGAEEVISSVFEINFNRICPMVKLKPNKGQSLRVQVGYPAGITYETLADYDLKAYHFTRCSNDPEYYCDEVKDALKNASADEKADILKAHKWGEHIIGTEQIDIVPTPYGMVIMCSAFSPFEIVAVKKSDTAASAIAETEHNVVVVSGENGKVKIGSNYAVGENGNKTVADGGSLEFTVEPASGYVVDTVSFGGTTVKATGNNTYKLEDVKKSDVLNVTFIPDSVQDADEEAGYATVVAEVCTHSTTHKVTEEGKTEQEPTCTKPGYAFAVVCSTCGQAITPAHEIPATGHTPATKADGESYYKEGTPAGCTTGGKNAYVKCTTPGCNAVLSDGNDTSPLGHIFTNYKEGTRDCHGVTLTATCDRDGCDVVDTKVNPDGRVDHEYTVPDGTTDPTCTQDATKTFKCKWCDLTKTETVPNTATGHTPKDDGSGVCKNCEAYICASDKHDYQPTEKKLPTCTEPGHEAGVQCKVCGHWQTREVTIPALGHDFAGHTAGTKCSRCDTVMKNDNHTFVDMPQKAATCDDEGSTGGKWCSECHYIDPANKPTVVSAPGHSWNTNSPEWNWSTEGKVSASVTLTCTNDPTHKETIAATVERTAVTEEATCIKTGTATYTATVTLPDETTVTDTKAGIVVPMTAHDPGSNPVKKTPATCTHHATKAYTCSVCKQEIVETVEGELRPHEFIAESSKSTAPTCTQAGKTVSICAVCREETEDTVAALGHNYVNGVCTRCGAVQPSAPSGSTGGSSRTETVTGADGSRTTTVTAADGSKTATTTTADGVVGTTKTDADGNVTSVEVIMPYGSETGEAVVAPVKVKASASSEDAPEIGITVREGSARVEIPVEEVSHGAVAVIVDEDGNETVVRDCAVDENGVIITVDGSVTVKIVDRSVDFADVQTAGHWASDAVEFVAARDLFKGTGEGVFSPETAMERGMLVTVLHRLAYEPEADSTQMTFGDIQSSDYFAEASAWANANHIVEGYNGSFRPHDDVSREDLVTILYRYAKFKGYATEADGNALASFTDVQNIRSYAVDAMNWAVSVGLVNGVSADRLAPQSGAKRAEVATIIERFCENVIK